MPFTRLGSRAACGGNGCNARLVYGTPCYVEERDGQALRRGTVLCVECATRGAPRDLALVRKAERGEDLSDREQARAVWLLDQEPAREERVRLWERIERRQRMRDRQKYGSSEREMARIARVKAAPKKDLDADDLAFLARVEANEKRRQPKRQRAAKKAS